jgi:hypothetical protein
MGRQHRCAERGDLIGRSLDGGESSLCAFRNETFSEAAGDQPLCHVR